MTISRRQFVNSSAMALTSASLLSTTGSLNASPMDQPIGFQNFEIIPYLEKDWAGTWKRMKDMGYSFVDFVAYSPRSPLGKLSAKDVLQGIQDAGLTVTNGHFGYAAMTDNYAQSMAFAHDLGLASMVCGPSSRRKTIDDWKFMGDQLNQIGAKTQKEGIQLGYHNHEVEFVPIEGQKPYDVLMATTDPKLVKFQIDVGNLAFGGSDAIEYLKKYSGRYYSLHVKDIMKGKASVPVGTGSLDWKAIFAIAAQQKIKSYVAEVGAYGVSTLNGEPLEPSPIDVMESFRLSAIFISRYKA